MPNKSKEIMAGEQFNLYTEIHTNIEWLTLENSKENEKARKDFEIKIQEFANFLNEGLGDIILEAINQAQNVPVEISKN